MLTHPPRLNMNPCTFPRPSERFASEYLSKSLSHLISVLKHQPERGAAFSAIAEMASALSVAYVGCVGRVGAGSSLRRCL